MSLLISCEHGGNDIPTEYAHLFSDSKSLLESHRGYDPGALELSRKLAEALDAPLFFSTVSRLLVDLNRSPHNRTLFSEVTRDLPPAEKEALLEKFYFPYRRQVEAAVKEVILGGRRLFHLSVHSFTPFLREERRADVSLLYHPAREVERSLAERWVDFMRAQGDSLRIRRNYPYRGISDGLVAALRKRFPQDLYFGLELEFNQSFPLEGGRRWEEIQQSIVRSFVYLRPY